MKKMLLLFSGLFPWFVQAQGACQLLSTQAISKTSSQALVIQSINGVQARLTACQRVGKGWRPALSSPFKAVIGKSGMIDAKEKKEGDLKTPMGLYALGPAFGTEPLALHMDYRFITAADKFVDDQHHPDYNQWVVGDTQAKSYEPMLIPLYRLGAVIQYNMHPAVPGAGSAIFLHVWKGPAEGTMGCVALSEKNVRMILSWLDKRKQPHIFLTSH